MRILRTAAVCSAAFVAVLAGVAGPADAAATWLPPTAISTLGPTALVLQVAVDANGNAFAVWQSSSGGHYRVLSARRPAGGTWTSPVRVSAQGRDAFDPRLAVDRRGDAFAIWASQDASHIYRVQVARRPAGGTWGNPKTLSAAGQHADRPQLAANANGTTVAVWRRSDGTNDRIQAARWAGGAWSAPKTLSAGGQDAFAARVAVDPTGGAAAVWLRYDSTGHARAQVARQSTGGSWTAPETLSAVGQDADEPEVAVDGHANTTVVWVRLGDQRVQSARRPAGGAWGSPVDLSASASSAQNPQVVADANGNVFAVWLRTDTTSYLVQVAMRRASGSWQPADPLSLDGQNAADPQIAVNSAGRAVAAWDRASVVQAARRSPGSSWGSPEDLSAGGDGASHAQVAVDNQGNAVAVWQRAEGLRAQAAGLDAAGPTARVIRPRNIAQTTTTFAVAWSATDRWSPIASYDVRYQDANYADGFGSPVTFRDAESLRSASFNGTPGHTYCFAARARDTVVNVGAWSQRRCTAVPLDDRALATSDGWQRSSGSANYLHTITVGTNQDATLTRTGVQTKRILLLVTRCPGCGSVTVSFGGHPLGTFSLAAATTRSRQLIAVHTFPTVRSGALKLRIASSGKPVRIDGVVLSRG